MTSSRAALRSELRARRRAVPPDGQQEAAAAVAAVVMPWLEALAPGVVAGYLATDGEVSPGLCLAAARRGGAQTVYPRIADDAMTFHTVGAEEDLVQGGWGLLEPRREAPLVSVHDIDVVLVPLVGFDGYCHRIGRGKAYYDRAFAAHLIAPRPRPPYLVGVAHGCQRVDTIPVADHDVTLDAVVTPAGVAGTLPSRRPFGASE
jgi:5-formyltetrahydrofolate cyclo-ligase